MADTANALSAETGLSADLVHKGLGAILDFLRQHVGAETFDRITSAVPNASEFLHHFESAPDSGAGGGLIGALTGLASKFLGDGAGDMTKLLAAFNKLGFEPAQIEAFLPKALAFIRSHLPPDLVEHILAKIPALAQLEKTTAGAG